ncbi:MAG TPA: hypothetical protein VF916_12530 [Ktedonobacterales bacterium]
MANATADLRARIQALLASDLDRGALLRELEALGRDPDFSKCADLWAPALYHREPYFFSTFLLRHLSDEDEQTIRALLPLAEADGHDELFTGLYRKIASEDEWNAELLALAQSGRPDDAVAHAVQLRDMSQTSYTLAEPVALALYERNPALFTPFVRAHVHDDGGTYAQLRAAALQRGDDEFSWALFRELADPKEWKAELHRLLHQHVPASAIAAELRKRHPVDGLNADGQDLAELVTRYGAAVVPYIEENLEWLDQNDARHLLPALEQLGDESLYWSIFFKTRNAKRWNEALRDLLKRPIADDALRGALQRRTPPVQEMRWSWWALDANVAEALYHRSPEVARPFLERCLTAPPLALYHAAEREHDEDFLDFLSARLMRQVASLTASAYLSAAELRYQQPNKHARAMLEELGRTITTRFDRLVAESPASYVRHAANMLGRVDEHAFGSFKRDAAHNPVVVYLMQQRQEDWCRSPEAIRDLLESPNIFVQIIGLTHLRAGGAEAAQRVVENVASLRALLLDRSRRGTKTLTLACLDQAGRQSAEHARQIEPVLAEALHFQGKRAIDERVMVSYVRLRRLWMAPVAQQTA